MNKKVIETLNLLKEPPSNEAVDHLLLLEKIYNAYANGIKELEPIVIFYLNGFDDLPTMQEKDLWNKLKFNEARKDFVNAHSELVELIEKITIDFMNEV